MKKAMGMFAALILALGMTGVAFAHWSQTLNITGTVETGNLCVGIRDVGTSDPGTTIDQMFDLSIPGPVPAGKHVGTAESVNGELKCKHGGDEFYHDITFTVTNAYPEYYWEEHIEIANCGTTPVKLASIEYYDYTTGMWKDLFGAPSDELWSGVLADDIWMGSWSLAFPSGTISGTWYHELLEAFATLDTQLDECDVAAITLGFFLYEDETSIPEMNETSTLKLKVTFTQWNLVP